MAFAGALDPTFGGGLGSSLIPVQVGAMGAQGITALAQVAVESDNSVLAAGPVSLGSGGTTAGVIHLKADGTRDTSFGNGGEADLSLPSGVTTNGEVTSLLVQPGTGNIYLTMPASASIESGTLVASFKPNGTPNTGFGVNGVEVLDMDNLGITASLNQAAFQPNGQLVLAGLDAVQGSPGVYTDIVGVVRLNSAGTPDPTFNGTGVATVSDIPPADLMGTIPAREITSGLAIEPNGQPVVVATIFDPSDSSHPLGSSELIRLNANGSRDRTISQAGLQASGLIAPTGVVIQADGSVVILGSEDRSNSNMLVKLNPDASLNRTLALPQYGSGVATTFALQPNGGLALLGPSGVSAIRVNANLTLDTTFGQAVGMASPAINLPTPSIGVAQAPVAGNAVAVGPNGQIVIVGTNATSDSQGNAIAATYLDATRLTATGTSARPGDYTGDGVSDPAIYLTANSVFGIVNSDGSPGQLVQFGSSGLGKTIPVPGNYYGTGQDDIAVYLPTLGAFAVKDPSGKTAGEVVQLGSTGAGQSIPVPGDFYGTGRDDFAVYLTSTGTFAVQDPTGKTSGKVVQFGAPGVGQTIPVPGDYYGTGQTDLAVFLPGSATWAIQDPTGKTAGQVIQFGSAGQGNSIPAPGDYDGSGKTELAVYLPSSGVLIYRPANGGADVTIPFGLKGAGQTLPAPGDYDGSGKTEVAAYMPSLGLFAYRPANGGPDVYIHYGTAGVNQTVPVTSVVSSSLVQFPPTASPGAFGLPDTLDFLPTVPKKKDAGTTP